MRLLGVVGSVVDGFGEGITGHELELLVELAVQCEGGPVVVGVGFGLELIDGVVGGIDAFGGEDEPVELLRCGGIDVKSGGVLGCEDDGREEVCVDGATEPDAVNKLVLGFGGEALREGALDA